MLKKMCLPLLLLLSLAVTAQTTTPDKHIVAMQRMLMKIVAAAPGDFASIKGVQESQQGNAVFYQANLTGTVTDFAEMKEALATDFFGALLTTDDHIVVSPEGTIFLARYTDDGEVSMVDMVTQAITTLPAYVGGDKVKVDKIAGPTADQTIYVLSYNDVFVGKLSADTKAGTAAVIIGIKK